MKLWGKNKKKSIVDKNELFQTCMQKQGIVHYATDIAKYVDSPFSLYCKYFVDKSEQDPIDPYMQELAKQGQQHERVYKEEQYPDAVPIKFETPEQGFEMIIQSMISGTNSLLGMPLFYLPDGMCGYPDILERRDGKSIFGEHHYIIKEIKLARNLKLKHILQGAFYNKMIGKIQKYTPDVFYLINMDDDEYSFQYSDYQDQLDEAIKQATEIRNGLMPPPIYNSCKSPWQDYCNKQAINAGDISLINKIGPSLREKFVAHGIKTIDDLIKCDESELLQIKGVGKKTAYNYLNHAKALKSGKHIRKANSYSFPNTETEIFLDLEGLDAINTEELDQTDYLIGILVRKGNDEKYHSFIAKNSKDEKNMLMQFLEFVKKQKNYAIYHWHHYERTHLKKMMEKYGVDSKTRDLVLSDNVIFDLHKISTSTFEFPVCGTSIKDIAKWLEFEWTHKGDVDAMNSINLYLEYASNPKRNQHMMDLILDYNCDDCKATLLIKDWLIKNSQQV